MKEILTQFGLAVWDTMLALSPSLLLGLFLAGVLHVFLPGGWIRKALMASSMGSVFKAVLVGVPMPLCSCGVLPAALSMRKDGASRSATTGFLISTPQTGVDSILVTASFLGWPFALFKVAAAFVTGLLGGALVNLTEPKQAPAPVAVAPQANEFRPSGRLAEIFHYALFDLLAAIDVWIVLGVLLSAIIGLVLPVGSLADVHWIQGLGGMLLVLLIALPMYVCTTGSVPIAAALIGAGMPLGSALVFLMAGPATNLATIGAIFKAMGRGVTIIYLGVTAVMSILFGLGFDWLLGSSGTGSLSVHSQHGPGWLSVVSASLVVALLLFLIARRVVMHMKSSEEHQATADGSLVLKVNGMTCMGCVAHVKRALEADPGVDSAQPELKSGMVWIKGHDLDPETLAKRVEQAGYQSEPLKR